MANATEVLIADAVAAELNDSSRTWAGMFTAARKWLPVYEPDDLLDLQVATVPLTIEEEEKISRDREKMLYGIGIDFQKKVNTAPDADNSEMDALTKLAQDVHDFYRLGRRLSTLDSAKVMEATRTEIFVESELYGGSVWETYVFLKILLFR